MPSKCSSVDLPAPDGPMMDTNSPSFTSALMRRSTKVFVGPCSKYFSTFRRTIRGELIGYLYYDEAEFRSQKSEFALPSRARQQAVSGKSQRGWTEPAGKWGSAAPGSHLRREWNPALPVSATAALRQNRASRAR